MTVAMTDGTDRAIVAFLVDRRFELTHTPTEIAFNPATWYRWLPADLHSLVDELGGIVDMRVLQRLSVEADSKHGRRRLFTATLIWGLGKKNARLLPGFARALGHTELDSTLRETARLIRKGWSAEAYDAWIARGLPGLGEAFFTKWFFAAGLDGLRPSAPVPLVLDDNVWKSLKALGWSSERTTGRRYRTRPSAAYAAFNASVDRWAESITTPAVPVTSIDIEQFLFHSSGTFCSATAGSAEAAQSAPDHIGTVSPSRTPASSPPMH